jgi:PilZ domain-containing protein
VSDRWPEKRRTQRIQPFVAPCRVLEGSRRLVGYLVDLSPQGAQVATQGTLPAVHAQVVLEVRLGRGVFHSRLPAQVLWVRGEGPGPGTKSFGLSFGRLSSEERQALEAVVEEFRRKASQLTPPGGGGSQA